jgi:O-acetyl-ADP-ribose deacetylase (regulator of RNase III)
VRLIYLDLVSFDFASTTANFSDCRCVIHGFAQRTCGFVFVSDPDSLANSATAYRRPFQKSESALDRSGGDGWSCLGHCDRST